MTCTLLATSILLPVLVSILIVGLLLTYRVSAAQKNGPCPDKPKNAQVEAKRASFHQRARESHAEARKLLTAMSVGGLGVLYATLIGKEAPKLDDAYSAYLAIGIAVSMALAAVSGLTGWKADARWAYELGQRYQDEKSFDNVGKKYHRRKNWCDRFQVALFVVGLFLAGLLTFKLILDIPHQSFVERVLELSRACFGR